MRFISTITSLLIAGGLSGFVCAQPLEIEGQIESRNPSEIEVQRLKLVVAAKPTHDGICPATNNGPGKVYEKHTYTTNQINAAFMAGAQLAADGKQIGDRKYPHVFGNNEKLPFDCDRDKMEFPIQMDNKIYNGGAVDGVPDRVVFEYREKKDELTVKYCGVMRHGPGVAFLNCA